MGHHQHDPRCGLRSPRIDRGDPPAGDRRIGERGIDHVVETMLRGEGGGAGDLQRSVQSRDRLADQPMLARDQRIGLATRNPAVGGQRHKLFQGALHQALRRLLGGIDDAHAASPMVSEARTAASVRVASAGLKPLSRRGRASANSAAAASRNACRVGGHPATQPPP